MTTQTITPISAEAMARQIGWYKELKYIFTGMYGAFAVGCAILIGTMGTPEDMRGIYVLLTLLAFILAARFIHFLVRWTIRSRLMEWHYHNAVVVEYYISSDSTQVIWTDGASSVVHAHASDPGTLSKLRNSKEGSMPLRVVRRLNARGTQFEVDKIELRWE